MVTTTKDFQAEGEELEAPSTDEGEERADTPELQAALKKQLAQLDDKEHDSRLRKMQNHLAKQPKVKIRVAKDRGPQTVIINGARYNIPAGITVEVPEPVADLLRDADLI